MVKVLLLAAGIGSRLGNLTADKHKSLLAINGEQSILDYQLRSMDKAGLNEVNIVVGHCSESLALHCQRYSKRHNISLIKNDHYASKNIDWSVYLGLTSIDEDLIYIEGDMVLQSEILMELKQSTADICLIVDQQPKSQHVDTVVRSLAERGTLFIDVKEHGFHSDTSLENALGEFVCAIKISNRARQLLLDKLTTFEFDDVIQFYSAINDILPEVSFCYRDCQQFDWVEVDNVKDLERAKELCQTTNFGLDKG
ncbi:TPA: NTP transferase domain-containing protein [Vibrio vulnificus]|nr:NTP transferase domain-containing protein [Vibrio vulnificus]